MTIQEIVENKATLIAQKKAEIKHADGVGYSINTDTVVVNKATNDIKSDTIQVKAVINTTRVLDSHGDVHIDGLWNKSLKENKMIMHLQEHSLKFDSIIADGKDLKASAKTVTFKELGYDMEGETQVLLFDSTVKRDRNMYMFKQYADGHVNNHSVGMQYVKLFLAVNDEDYKEEKAIWDKYYPMIANKQDADAQGYFWAVTEAKVIEGSAVPIGSNQITPTIEVSEAADKGTSTKIEPSKGTQLSVKEFKNILKKELWN